MATDALIAELLRGQGAIMERLDALEKLICDYEKDDEGEKEAPDTSDMVPPNPLFSSNQLEFDIPSIVL